MDLGFSRRERDRDARNGDADRLRSLLAEIAMRQSMTATARMQPAPQEPGAGGREGATLGYFAPVTCPPISAAAFHAQVAAAIVNDRQDS